MTEQVYNGMTLGEAVSEIERLHVLLGGPDRWALEAGVLERQKRQWEEGEARRRNEAQSFRAGTALEYPGSLEKSRQRPRPAQRYLIDGLWGAAHNLSIEALFKTGKTALLCSAAGALADGGDFLGCHPVHKPAGTIAVWNTEMDADDFDDYLAPHVTDAARVCPAHLRSHPMPLLTSPAARSEAVWWLRGASVWLIDSWTRLCAWNGIDPADNFAVGRLTAALDEIKAEAGVGALAVTSHMPHAARGDRMMERALGAQAFSGWVDVMWRYVRDESGQRFLSAEGRRARLAECQVWMDGTGRLVAQPGDREAAATGREAVTGATTELTVLMTVREHPGSSTSGIVKAVGKRKKDVLVILAKMTDGGLVRSQPGTGNEVLWFPC